MGFTERYLRSIQKR